MREVNINMQGRAGNPEENEKFMVRISKGDYPDEWGIDVNNFDKEAEIAKYKGLGMKAREAVAIRLFIRPKMQGKFLIPDSIHEDQKFSNCVGLVVKVSKNAYKSDDKRFANGPWCEEGDWVIFPRHAGDRLSYKNSPIFFIWEDGIWTDLEDPRDVTR
jgi:hypothetical protein